MQTDIGHVAAHHVPIHIPRVIVLRMQYAHALEPQGQCYAWVGFGAHVTPESDAVGLQIFLDG